MQKQGFVNSLISIIAISILILSIVPSLINNVKLIGLVVSLLGLLPWIPLKIADRSLKSVGSDIIFGAIDTGILGVA